MVLANFETVRLLDRTSRVADSLSVMVAVSQVAVVFNTRVGEAQVVFLPRAVARELAERLMEPVGDMGGGFFGRIKVVFTCSGLTADTCGRSEYPPSHIFFRNTATGSYGYLARDQVLRFAVALLNAAGGNG